MQKYVTLYWANKYVFRLRRNWCRSNVAAADAVVGIGSSCWSDNKKFRAGLSSDRSKYAEKVQNGKITQIHTNRLVTGLPHNATQWLKLVHVAIVLRILSYFLPYYCKEQKPLFLPSCSTSNHHWTTLHVSMLCHIVTVNCHDPEEKEETPPCKWNQFKPHMHAQSHLSSFAVCCNPRRNLRNACNASTHCMR